MAVLGGKFTTLEGMLKDIRELVSTPEDSLTVWLRGNGLGGLRGPGFLELITRLLLF